MILKTIQYLGKVHQLLIPSLVNREMNSVFKLSLILGIARTINTSNYVYLIVMEKIAKFGHPEAIKVFTGTLILSSISFIFCKNKIRSNAKNKEVNEKQWKITSFSRRKKRKIKYLLIIYCQGCLRCGAPLYYTANIPVYCINFIFSSEAISTLTEYKRDARYDKVENL